MIGGARSRHWGGIGFVVLAAVTGVVLQVHEARSNSATYDEPTYLRVASRWWRTGDQTEITRMGSPLTFWKLQQAPVFAYLDLTGRGTLIHEPMGHQRELLPLVRIGSLWIWLVALGATSWWSRRLYGPRAMIFAAWLFTLGPNLLAHGALATMETPLVATTALLFALFWRFLETGKRRWFVAAAIVCGLAWSCKFTAVLYPPILGLAWWLDRWRGGGGSPLHLACRVAIGMLGFVAIAGLANFAITAGAMLPLSPTHEEHPSLIQRFGPTWGRRLALLYETPIPQDWVGFAVQTQHQASGGSSYLFGERRMMGWWYYYFVTLAVKVPLSVLVFVAARSALRIRGWKDPGLVNRHEDLIPLTIACLLAITAIGSARNYGLRYLLPLAPLAIVWVSALAEIPFWNRFTIPIGLLGAGIATATIHPHELTYFNVVAGGPIGGRRILSDSNLDWGQGLLGLAEIQRAEPEFGDLTLYYFGETDPAHYGIVGTRCVVLAVGDHHNLPGLDSLKTRYVAVSASLEWGPWGTVGFFDRLRGVEPVRMTDDTTIAIYRVDDIPKAGTRPQ